MNAHEVAVVRRWLRENRGKETQEGLAAAITAALPDWNITRDRYSKYESGPLSIGPDVLAHFVDYWRTQGKPGPDFNPLMPVAPIDPMAAALMALAVELAAAREERARYLAMEGTVKALEETVAGLLRSSRKAGGSGVSQAGRAPRGSAG